ncbi:MAG: efflux RND transporter periplasmic adaptor subunit, partial [Candidatus Latescibacteria bacterium]|nr:efflux RND transporter periplasmic adaptor subunit [Candidatus Latescibacterota bacterium]
IFVPEKQIQQVKKGQAVRIGTEGAGTDFTGKVRMISPIVDPESGTVKVTVEIRDKTRTMRPGMFATVNIITETRSKVNRVEKRALVAEAEGTFAFLFNGGKAKKVRLELGADEGEWIEVTGGLSEGDSVITVGHEGLRNGAPVRIAGQAVASSPGASDGGPKGAARTGAPAQGGGGGGMMGGMDLDQMKQRAFGRNPKIKEAFDKKAADDPDFAKNEEKQRAFLMEQFRQMRAAGGGGGGRPQ